MRPAHPRTIDFLYRWRILVGMYYSRKRRLLLIPNPRCATASVCKSLQLGEFKGWSPLRPLGDFRRKHPDAWEECDTLLVVRDPVQRFLSCADYLGLTPDALLMIVGNWKKHGRTFPRLLRPQSDYLCRVTYLVGLPWLAEFFNHLGLPPLKKDGVLRAPGRPRDYSPGVAERVWELYPRDVELLGPESTTSPLWSPDESTPRFLWGDCSSCAAQVRRNSPGG